jgi:hypothetical protein
MLVAKLRSVNRAYNCRLASTSAVVCTTPGINEEYEFWICTKALVLVQLLMFNPRRMVLKIVVVPRASKGRSLLPHVSRNVELRGKLPRVPANRPGVNGGGGEYRLFDGNPAVLGVPKGNEGGRASRFDNRRALEWKVAEPGVAG